MTPSRRTRTGIAIAAAAIIGALALPVWRVGIGWPLAALAVVLVVATARTRTPNRSTIDGERRWRIAAGIAALALVTVAGLRAAEWLVLLCLIAATALGSYTLTGGRTWRGLAGGLTALPGIGLWALVRSAPGGGTSQSWRRVGVGVGCGLVLLFVFGALFRAADPAFAQFVDDWSGSFPRVALGFVIVGLMAMGAVGLTIAPVSVDGVLAKDWRRLGLAEWIIPLVMLDALFALFIGTQATVLFAGHDHVLTGSGPDYADYARDGFGQLTVVTVLTLGVVAVLSLVAGRATASERVLLRACGGVLCALTLLVVASALTRLALYTDAYGFNVPRLLGFATEIWLGLIFVLILVAGIRLRARWLPRAVAAVGTCVLLAIAAINPDAMMARTHIDRTESGYPLDLPFLSRLSADAIDEIDSLPEPARSCVLRVVAERLDTSDPWYGYNPSRQHARTLIQDETVLTCDEVL